MSTKENTLFSDPKNGIRLVRCSCGHKDIPENVRKVGWGATACLNCYEEAKTAEENDRGTYELHGGYR